LTVADQPGYNLTEGALVTEVMRMPEVTIYTKPGCPYCAAAKEDLARRGIAYKEINAEGDPKALEEMLRLNGGQRTVPTVVENGNVTVGFGGR